MMKIKTKNKLFQTLPNIPNPTLVTGSNPTDYCNMWFIVKSSTDRKAPLVELQGCKLIRPSVKANESYFRREKELLKKYNQWIQEYLLTHCSENPELLEEVK